MSDAKVTTAPPVPHLRASGRGVNLIVNGEPTLLLGGQVHNSVPSSPARVRAAFDRVSAMHANFVIGSASWALVEPTEGHFDFSHVDAQIAAARQCGIRLVLIWFGAFKNAASTYAPTWVRADTDRFPRARIQRVSQQAFTYPGAMSKPVLSVFSTALRAADRDAFARLVRHLATTDPEHVVVMVQIENEIGLLGDSRDRSSGAEAAWHEQVPTELVAHLEAHADILHPELNKLWRRRAPGNAATWADVFGTTPEAEEVFMAWAFGSYVEEIAAAGKSIKPLPMYVNAWLGPQPGQQRPGEYPSGGPGSRVLDVWKAAAPSLDLLAPDIYQQDVQSAMEDYDRPDNPLFVPETTFRTGSLFWALGQHGAFGFSVFGVENARQDSQLARAYALLAPMQHVIISAQAEDRIVGIVLDGDSEMAFSLGGMDVVARSSRHLLERMLLDVGVQPPPPPPPPLSETQGPEEPPAPADARPFGLLIAEGDDTFLLVGQGLTIDFSHDTESIEVNQVEAGRYEGSQWTVDQVLNGDERLHVIPLDELGAARIRLLRVPA